MLNSTLQTQTIFHSILPQQTASSYGTLQNLLGNGRIHIKRETKRRNGGTLQTKLDRTLLGIDRGIVNDCDKVPGGYADSCYSDT